MNEEKWRSNQREVLNGGWRGIGSDQIRLFCLAETKTINGYSFSWGHWCHMVTIITVIHQELKAVRFFRNHILTQFLSSFKPKWMRFFDSVCAMWHRHSHELFSENDQHLPSSSLMRRDRRWHMSIRWWQTEVSLFIQPKLIKQSIGFLICSFLRTLVAIYLKQHKRRLTKT